MKRGDKVSVNLTVGSAILPLLEQMGVKTIFGLPGVHTIEIYRGISKTDNEKRFCVESISRRAR